MSHLTKVFSPRRHWELCKKCGNISVVKSVAICCERQDLWIEGHTHTRLQPDNFFFLVILFLPEFCSHLSDFFLSHFLWLWHCTQLTTINQTLSCINIHTVEIAVRVNLESNGCICTNIQCWTNLSLEKNEELQLTIQSDAMVIPVLQCENWRREAAANEGERDGWIFC